MRLLKLFIISIPLFLTSCGTTYIMTDKGNDIYINGEFKAQEMVEIKRNGAPKKLAIKIQNGNTIVNETKIKRRFTIKTGVMTYVLNVIGFLTTWQFKKEYYFEGQKKPKEENIWEKDPDKRGIWQ